MNIAQKNRSLNLYCDAYIVYFVIQILVMNYQNYITYCSFIIIDYQLLLVQ
jgi:hypothetical protein